jgi:sulfotransferase family protein
VIFLLSSPRCGSTLLRVMLAGHPDLFCPPELNLLPYRTMREWSADLGARATPDCDQREGLQEAVMNLEGLLADAGRRRLDRLVERDVTVEEVYSLLRQQAWPRTLLDKTPLNASSPAALERTRTVDPGARYLFLARHPVAVIQSLVDTYFQTLARPAAVELGERIWTGSNANILTFLAGVEPARHFFVTYEKLVGDCETVLREICEFLGISFEPVLLRPYDGGRMTSGVRGDNRFVGDRNFFRHDAIDASLADAWRSTPESFALGEDTRRLAAQLGYALPETSGVTASASGAAATAPIRIRLKYQFSEE